MKRLPFGALIAFALLHVAVWAQDEMPTQITNQNRIGDLPFSTSVGSGVERVDLGNGSAAIEIPIVSLPGRAGHRYNISLNWTGLFWTVATQSNVNGSFNGWANEGRGTWIGDTGSVQNPGSATFGLGWTMNGAGGQLNWSVTGVSCDPSIINQGGGRIDCPR